MFADGDMLLSDPYEVKVVQCALSQVSGIPGDGLFAKKDVKANKVVAFYSGIRRPMSEASKGTTHWKRGHEMWMH